MSIVILKPGTEAVYEQAVKIFQRMYEAVTGKSMDVAETDDGKSDLVVIGSDAVNDFVLHEILELRLDGLGIRYGTDDYCIRTYTLNNRRMLILAGGRGRSAIYAIYDYFERYLNCHYFWDGDVIPHSDTIPMQDIDIRESPRFEYRGLRYFAHRGLKRFQAEHWSLEDWKQELDWMVKKRLNFFMLRIGMDDVWQRAFPDDVPYPKDYLTVNAESYDDRSDFWTLEYRGKLREKILEYARSLDLTYPTDCGTMTHWYSRTPKEFLEKKKPSFAHQDSKQYCEDDGGRVWDYTKKENMDSYMRLTETMVNEYEKSTALFHTIGLGERDMYHDRKKNHAAKRIAYRRIAENIRQKYPDSKLMLASWDFVGWWTAEEVQSLIGEMDPERTILLDYTSEISDPNESFLNWGVVGKFPWIFGLFHAYESESEWRGPYDRSDARLKIAAADPFCKGMILWPELSHSDPLVLEYLSQNAWAPTKSIEEITEVFCHNRYGMYSENMNKCCQKLLPFIKLGDWGSYSRRKRGDEKYIEYCSDWYAHQAFWTKITKFLYDRYANSDIRDYYFYKLALTVPLIDNMVSALELLASDSRALKEPFILRDSVDMTRTVLGRLMNFLIILALDSLENKERIQTLKDCYIRFMNIMSELLTLNTDFSLYHTLKSLEETAPTNPNFEKTLKRNIYNSYCVQPAYELVTHVFREEGEIAFAWLMTAKRGDAPDFVQQVGGIRRTFMETPLEKMQPERVAEADKVILKAAKAVEEFREIALAKNHA